MSVNLLTALLPHSQFIEIAPNWSPGTQFLSFHLFCTLFLSKFSEIALFPCRCLLRTFKIFSIIPSLQDKLQTLSLAFSVLQVMTPRSSLYLFLFFSFPFSSLLQLVLPKLFYLIIQFPHPKDSEVAYRHPCTHIHIYVSMYTCICNTTTINFILTCEIRVAKNKIKAGQNPECTPYDPIR